MIQVAILENNHSTILNTILLQIDQYIKYNVDIEPE